MSRTIALAALAALLILAPSAHADLTVSTSGDTTVVTGDGSANQLQVQDGNLADPQPYAFAFYSESGETILEGGNSTCASDGGAGGGVENVYCGNASVNKVVFNLGGGDDTIGWFNDPVFTELAGLTVDFGAGSDGNESGLKGVPTSLSGGADADDLSGLDGPTSVVDGGPGNDRIIGGGGLSGETLRGGDGDDEIQGLNGADQIFGDGGQDTLVGGAGGDTITGGAGLDNVEGDGVPNAFSGNDTLILNDGERDVAACGFGADSATIDALDLLSLNDCESVTGGATTPPPGGGITQSGTAKVALAKPGKLSARKRRLAVKVTCPASASGSCSGRVTFTLRFTERGKKRKVSAGSVSFVLAPGASKAVRKAVSKKLVRRLRKAKKRKLTIRATSRDNAGRSFTSTRTATLKLGR